MPCAYWKVSFIWRVVVILRKYDISIFRVRLIGKSGFRFWKSKSRFHLREIHPQGGFQLRNPNPDFLDFPFCRSIGESDRKRICKTVLVNSGLLFTNYACACKTAVPKDSFSNPFSDFPIELNRTVKRKIQKQIFQHWNPFSDFTFDCKSEIQILKSKSRFPNPTHPYSYWIKFPIMTLSMCSPLSLTTQNNIFLVLLRLPVLRHSPFLDINFAPNENEWMVTYPP